MPILKETHLEGLGERTVGKVRDLYTQPDKIIIVATDRHSSFDRVIAHIPHKGQVVNQLSAFWFKETQGIVPNHLIEIPDPQVTVAKKYTPLPVEMVVRGFISGVTSTALWTRYQKGQRDFGNFKLPDGLAKNQKLYTPIVTPTTKVDGHDISITPAEIIAKGLLTEDVWKKLSDFSILLFEKGQNIAARSGLILVDTKYEFGVDDKGGIAIINEMHTPDSSRYWIKDTYIAKFYKNEDPDNFDKEYLRVWFMEHCDPYKDATLPEAPAEMIAELSKRYIQVFEKITQTKFVPPPETEDIEARIKNNLKAYAI